MEYLSKAARSVETYFAKRYAERRIAELEAELESYFTPLGNCADGEIVAPVAGTSGRRSEIGAAVDAYQKVLKDLG